MKYLSLLMVVVLLLFLPRVALAQTLEGEDVKVEIRNIELKSSTKTTDSLQASAEFMENGYLLQTLPIDKSISLPFTSSPRSYLLRAKPGISLTLPLNINNYQSPSVIELSVVPFNSQSSIDCNVVQVSSCKALDWVSLSNNSEDETSEKILMDVGEAKEIRLELSFPDNAIEGDYYLSIRLSEYNKPYHYTSTDLYISITNNGIIDQSMSVESMNLVNPFLSIRQLANILPTVIFGSTDQRLLVKVINGSPVFGVADYDIRVRSLLGFERIVPVVPQVVLGNASTELSVNLEKLPFGLLTLAISDNLKIPALVIPNTMISLVTLISLVVLAFSFVRIIRNK